MKKISGQMIKEHFESINRDTMIIFVTTHNEIIYDSFGKNVYVFLEKPIVEKSFFLCYNIKLTDYMQRGSAHGQYKICRKGRQMPA